jgi:hypothetical protein
MKFGVTGQVKGDIVYTGYCLIEVIAWAGLTVFQLFWL